MLAHEIEAFGRRMGIEGLRLPEKGPLAFDVEALGRLHLEEDPEHQELLIYLTLPVPNYDRQAARRVLALCDYRKGLPLVLNGGVYKGQLMLLTRMDAAALTAGSLEATIRTLGQLIRQAAA